MQDLLDALVRPLRALACAAAEAHVSARPRGFQLYAVPLPEAELRALDRDWDVEDWGWLGDEVCGLAVAHERVSMTWPLGHLVTWLRASGRGRVAPSAPHAARAPGRRGCPGLGGVLGSPLA